MGARIIHQYNNQNFSLEFNEQMILLNNVCVLSIDFRDQNNGLFNARKVLNDWAFIFIFTDTVPLGKSGMTSDTSFADDNKSIIFTCYRWYGDGVENAEPFIITDTDNTVSFFVKLKTTAYISSSKKRTVDISIWKKIV